MKILCTINLTDEQQTNLNQQFPNHSFEYCKHMDTAKKQLADADILVTMGGDLSANLIKEAKQLKWIMLCSAGMDDMPLQEIKKAGILLTNVRGIHKVPMAEYVISMLLQVYRQAKVLAKNESGHRWEKTLRMHEISGRTMLVVGTGAIGQEVARLAKAFQMKTIGVSKTGGKKEYFDETHPNTDIQKVLPNADFVISVMPSTTETRHFYTSEHFQLMPDHAIFLNMGRGDVVQTEVLLKATRDREIAHVVLDVFEQEPLPANSPLWEEENITLTPHISGVSPEYMTRAFSIFVDNLNSFLDDGTKRMKNEIDITKGY